MSLCSLWMIWVEHRRQGMYVALSLKHHLVPWGVVAPRVLFVFVVLDFFIYLGLHDRQPDHVRLVSDIHWNAVEVADPGGVLIDDILSLCVSQ